MEITHNKKKRRVEKMKFKKTLSLIFIAILSFVLIACEDKSYMEEAIAEVDMLMEDLGFENGDTFSLINKYQSVTITWESMDLDIIDQNGDVNSIGLNTDVEVMIVVTFTEGKVTEERNYFVMVYKIDNTDPDPDPDPDPEPDPDEADREKINLVKNSLNLPETTRTNLDLVTLSNGVVLSWSSNHDAITSEGVVTRSEDEDIEVTLTVTLTSGNVTDTKEFVVIVEREDVLTEAKNSLVLPTSTDKNLELPLTTGKDNLVKVTWESNNVEVMTHEGVVNRSLTEDVTVTLTATLTYKEQAPQTRDFEVVVLKDPLLDNVVASLEVPTEVVRDLILPTNIEGVSIVWTSNNAAITPEGVVTRSQEESIDVTLTATLNYKGHEKELVFEVVVLVAPTERLSDPFGLVLQMDRKAIVGGAYSPGPAYANQLRFVWYLNGESVAEDIITHNSGGFDYFFESFLETLPAGTYTVKVQGLSNGTTALDSNLVEVPGTITKTLPHLDSFTLTLEENLVTWEPVLNAESYAIYVNDAFVKDTTLTSFEINPESLELLYGNHTIKVVASATGFMDSQATTSFEYVNENAQQVEAPTNLNIDTDGVLTWDSVEHATGYRIVVGSQTITLELETSFDLTTLNLAGGEHNVELYALGDGQDYLNSNKAEITYTAPEPAQQLLPLTAAAIVVGNDPGHYFFLIHNNPAGQTVVEQEGWDGDFFIEVIKDGEVVLTIEDLKFTAYGGQIRLHWGGKPGNDNFTGLPDGVYTISVQLVAAGYVASEPYTFTINW